MKPLCCICVCGLLFFSVTAQTSVSKDSAITLDASKLKPDESESAFPGGISGWFNFLRDNLVYPKKAIKKNIQGTVILQFIVDKDGAVSDINAIDGPELLREAAVNVIKKSPNWKPAMQHGKKVKSYKKQPITFKLEAG